MIGERLFEIRKDKGMKREELAKILAVSVHTISSYEQNRSSPDDETKVKIAKLFNVSLDYLLGASDSEKLLEPYVTIELPKGFPRELIGKVYEIIDIIFDSYKYNNKNK